MKILELIPKGARQIRYIHPQYDYQEDDEGNVVDEYCLNEDTCTEVWNDCVWKVHRYKTPLYYRRRNNELAREDSRKYSYAIQGHNNRQDDWSEACRFVRIRRLGRRVIFIHDENYMKKLWLKYKNKKYIKNKIANLPEKHLFEPSLNELNFEAIERDIAERAMSSLQSAVEYIDVPPFEDHYREREEITDEYNS